MRYVLLPSIALSLACLTVTSAYAQAWPSKPIRWIVPFGPGSSDVLMRSLIPAVGAALGQPILVENRPGASGSIGTEQVAKSPPDGYTLLLGAAATHAVNPALIKLNYDPVRDFAPVINLASIPNVVIVHPQLAVRSIAELVAAAKAKPETLTYSSNGSGSSAHMSAALFEMATGAKMVHVPHKGSSEAVLAVVRGDVNIMFANLPPAQPLIKDGRLRPIAVTTAQRLASMPELPTVAEGGVPGFEVATWFALFAPAGTPDAIVQRLNREFGAALANAETRARLVQLGFIINGGSPQDLGALVKNDLTRWARVVRETGAKAE